MGAMFARIGESVKKIIVYIELFVAVLCLATTETRAEDADFAGYYYGGKVGINNSTSKGAIEAPGESTIAYIVQGGYFHGGFNEKFGDAIVGAGGYIDLHGYEKHSNDVAYGGHSVGFDIKFGPLLETWLPYAKVGYGYSSGTGDLKDVSQFGFNKAIGGEYKLDKNWSLLIEYKINIFKGNSSEIENRTFMFGFNYFLEKPAPVKVEIDLTGEPEPEAIIDIAPEFAPPP